MSQGGWLQGLLSAGQFRRRTLLKWQRIGGGVSNKLVRLVEGVIVLRVLSLLIGISVDI